MANEKNRRERIISAVRDLAGALLWYDRKDDEDLVRGDVEAAIAAGEITREEIVEAFATALREAT